MHRLVDVTVRNDGLVAEMAERADTLVKLTDEARERQHSSNANIVESLASSDRKLRLERDIVDRGNEFTSAIAAVAPLRARPSRPMPRPPRRGPERSPSRWAGSRGPRTASPKR